MLNQRSILHLFNYNLELFLYFFSFYKLKQSIIMPVPTYQQFVKDNYSSASGATSAEKMKHIAKMWQSSKSKGGVLSGAGMKSKKTKGGVLSGASLEEDMAKLNIFKEHMENKPKKSSKKMGGVLSGASLAVNESDNEDSNKFYRQGTGIGF